MPGGFCTVEQSVPEFCAADTIIIPAAACASTAACNELVEQPSEAGQPQELIVISGALVGSGSLPLIRVGARNHCMHSMYLAGVPLPWSMLRQPIHFAPGAIPIWLPAPSSPMAVPVVWEPWKKSSQGACVSFPQGLPTLLWMESCQLRL